MPLTGPTNSPIHKTKTHRSDQSTAALLPDRTAWGCWQEIRDSVANKEHHSPTILLTVDPKEISHSSGKSMKSTVCAFYLNRDSLAWQDILEKRYTKLMNVCKYEQIQTKMYILCWKKQAPCINNISFSFEEDVYKFYSLNYHGSMSGIFWVYSCSQVACEVKPQPSTPHSVRLTRTACLFLSKRVVSFVCSLCCLVLWTKQHQSAVWYKPLSDLKTVVSLHD